MKEKVYRQAQFYGKLTTVTCQEYYLLAPLPVPGDDWQLEHQQTWFVVPNEVVAQVKVNGEYKAAYLEPRHIVTSFPTIDPYLRDGWVWTGEYYPDETTVDDQEPTEEDGPGSRIVAKRVSASVRVGRKLLGRTLDGLGVPMDGLGPLDAEKDYPLYSSPPNPLTRKRIENPLNVGIRAINGLLTVGKGQRIGIFAGSGVGKSVLMGMMARNTEADINVICLVGERGREVKEFIEKDLGTEGLKRSVIVVATSDQPPLIRMRAPLVATAIAEYFRDQGRDVLLMMDAISRFCMAQREIGLAISEPPATKGYPPSVFAHLPSLLERAGTSYQC